MSAAELVGVLNDVFRVFDELVERYGLEKVKTIGDAYMVVGGMPDRPTTTPPGWLRWPSTWPMPSGGSTRPSGSASAFRIGINCGPVVAGVIGTKKFIYDIWGDTVNLASRMESLGIPGRVQVTMRSWSGCGTFLFESRGLIEVKGKGPTPTYLLVDRVPATSIGSPDEANH